MQVLKDVQLCLRALLSFPHLHLYPVTFLYLESLNRPIKEQLASDARTRISGNTFLI